MKILRSGLPLLVAVVCLVAFSVYARIHSVNERDASAYESLLRQISAENFRRTSEVLVARAGLVRNYDELARTESTLKALHDRLRTPPQFLEPEGRQELLGALEESNAVRQKAERSVERFKQDLSILRNSTGYLRALAQQVSESAPAQSAKAAIPNKSFDGLLRDLLALQVTRDELTTRRAEHALARLLREDSSAPEWALIDLDLVRLHGELVMAKSVAVNQLVGELALLPTEARAQQLLSSYLRLHQSALRRDARNRAVLVTLMFATGAAIALYVILRLRKSAEELEDSQAQLESAILSLRTERDKQAEFARLKSRFVTTTSHEFRTPLSVILSSAEMVSAYAKEWSHEQKERHLARIRNAALNMTRLLEDILLLGRAESGRLEFSPAPFGLAEFCADVVLAAEQADGKVHRIIHPTPIPDATVLADENLLRHILANLLSNALKYSAEHENVELDASLTSGELCFCVRDRGIGIPEADQEQLFQSFHRGSNVGKIRGSGLGLSIVWHAVELQRGSIMVESRVAVGTSVLVKIPLANVEGKAA